MAMQVIQFGITEFQKNGIPYKWPDEIRKPTHEVEEVIAGGHRARGVPHDRVPVSIVVDELWPNDNLKYTFDLEFSGIYGFGRSAGGHYIKDGAPTVVRD